MPIIDQPDEAKNKDLEELKRELSRRSNDRVQVYNPLKEDFVVIWDGFQHRVRAGENAVLARYIAEKFVREIIDHMIGLENLERVEKENEHRKTSGQKEMDPQERETFDLRTNNPDLRKKYLPLVYKGVVEEYGMEDLTPEIPKKRAADRVDIDLIAQIDKKAEAKAPAKPAKQEKKASISKKVSA
jgi:hypothetical protein